MRKKLMIKCMFGRHKYEYTLTISSREEYVSGKRKFEQRKIKTLTRYCKCGKIQTQDVSNIPSGTWSLPERKWENVPYWDRERLQKKYIGTIKKFRNGWMAFFVD